MYEEEKERVQRFLHMKKQLDPGSSLFLTISSLIWISNEKEKGN